MQLNTHHQHWLNKRGITDEVLRLFNITTFNHPQIGDCIRIPFSAEHAKYRRDPLQDLKPKYLYDAGGKVTLYGADHLQPTHKTVVVTEGELDTLVLWSQNIPAVSSTGGAMSFQEEWGEVLKDRDVYLCFDNDPAGADGMVKALRVVPHAKVILLPQITDVKDISDYVSLGKDFRSLMAGAKHYADEAAIVEDKALRTATFLPTIFHEKWLEKNQPKVQQRHHGQSYTGDDKILRAKSYPMDKLIAFVEQGADRNKACCPWHNEKTPSLHYYKKSNSAYCFGGCGRSYDSIDAYMLLHNCDFKTAVRELNKLV